MPKKKKEVIEKTVASRPPIVTIMGHVDHGKTTLLDAIRHADVAAHEFGGITQAIGAYQVEIDTKDGKRKITFIDTPGHEAFEKMRSRGAQITDLAVIVIDGIDGVMPQTMESIEHCQKAEVPFLIAVNKMDLPDASAERVKKQLAKNNILVEGYGGDIVTVLISAKTKMGIENLLEMILLLFELKGAKSNPDGELDAVVIESKLDIHRGPSASIIVKNGTLKISDEVRIDDINGKIRAMTNDKGEHVKEALPGTPVEIVGLQKVPAVGGKVIVKTDENAPAKKPQEIKEMEMKLQEEKPKKLQVILKADAAGSLEAIERSLPGETIELLLKGVGEITDSDVLLAKASGAIIVGFNVKVPASVKKLADNERVLINTYQIIYQLLDDIIDAAQFVNTPRETEKVLGKAKIIALFPGEKYTIAGCKVFEGRIARNDTIKIVRKDEDVFHTKITSLKHGKEDIQKADNGIEFGATFDPQFDFAIDDMVLSYRKLI